MPTLTTDIDGDIATITLTSPPNNLLGVAPREGVPVLSFDLVR
jgi:hypothetical protein